MKDENPRVTQALQRLEEGVKAITESTQFTEWLRCAAKFHSYSWGNIMLIMAQRKDATQVAGFHTWKKLGRFVQRGEKAIWILAPMLISNGNERDEPESKLVGFKPVRVFDVSQTDGETLPQPPGVEILQSSSDRGELILRVLRGVMREENITYGQGPLAPVRGYWKPSKRQIMTDEALSVDMEVKVITHELAHAYADEFLEDYHQFRDEHETVAEGSAFVTLDHFGLDTAETSFGYVAHWAEDPSLVSKNLDLIQKVSHRLISVIDREMTVLYGERELPLAS